MTQLSDRLSLGALVLFLGATWWFGTHGGDSPDITGTVAVPTKVELHLVKRSTDADATTVITRLSDGEQLHLYRKHFGGIRADPKDIDKMDANGKRVWAVTDTSHYGLLDPGFDLGTFAGYTHWHQRHRLSEFQVGIRVSPLRLLYGTLAIDGLITGQGAGFGFSAYLPPSLVGEDFAHLGVGVGRLYAFQHGQVGNTAYLSFSALF